MVFNPAWIPAGLEAIGAVAGAFGGSGSSGLNREDQRVMADFSMRQSLRQEEDAKRAIQIRVADAEKAGIHPLAALGINAGTGPVAGVFSGSPSSPGRTLGDRVAEMGQGLGRAATVAMSQDMRDMNLAQLEKVKAEADYARALAIESVKRTSQIGANPAMPSTVQQFRAPDGSIVEGYSDEYARSLMSRPLSTWSADMSRMGSDMYRHMSDTINPFLGKVGRNLLQPWKWRFENAR